MTEELRVRLAGMIAAASGGAINPADVLAGEYTLSALGLTSLARISLIDTIEDVFDLEIDLGGDLVVVRGRRHAGRGTQMKIEFDGGTEGEAPLTWGQRLMWRAVHLMGDSQTYLNCPFVFPVYGRRELPAVLDALRVLIERHETLRTTFSSAGQRVVRDGVLEVELVEAGAERGLLVAERVAAEIGPHGLRPRRSTCRCAARWSSRTAARSRWPASSPTWRSTTRPWRCWPRSGRRCSAGGALPEVVWQPRDQAGLEASDAWQARSVRSIAYWRNVLDEVPLDVFDHPPGEPEDPRFIEVGMESTALAVAALRLSERLSVSTTSVLLAACATALSEASARSRVVMQLVHSNRRDARTREMVGTVGQDALIVLAVSEDFPEFCRTTHRAALQAYRNAQYDPDAMTRMRQEVGARRGREHDLDAFFNDRRPIAGWPALPPDADLSVAETRTYTENAWPGVRFKVFFTVGTAIDTGQLSIIADTAYLPGRRRSRCCEEWRPCWSGRSRRSGRRSAGRSRPRRGSPREWCRGAARPAGGRARR